MKHLLFSDIQTEKKLKDKTLHATYSYLEKNQVVSQRIEDCLNINIGLFDLIPFKTESFRSGTHFPFFEAVSDLRYSIYCALEGEYKYAFIALRSYLELSLLSVYFNKDYITDEELDTWYTSKSKTPFIATVTEKLLEDKNILEYQIHNNYIDNVRKIYSELSRYTHTRGFHYSSHQTKRFNNASGYLEVKILDKWAELYSKACEVVFVLYLLRYPIGIVKLPIAAKYGIDAPTFSHLRDVNQELVSKLLDKKTHAYLKELSLRDAETASLVNEINLLPNLSEEFVDLQLVNLYKEIAFHDYKTWRANELSKMNEYSTKDQARTRRILKIMDKWAVEQGLAK